MTPPAAALDPEEVAARLDQLALELSRAHPDGVVLVAASPEAAELVSQLAESLLVPVQVERLGVSDYVPGGRAQLIGELRRSVARQPVVLVDVVADTGLTLAFLSSELERRGAASVECCVLWDRAARRILPLSIRFRGFEVEE